MSLYDSLASANNPMNRKIYGVSVGIVTNNKDPEKLGRVKVKLPLRECQNETVWARVATLMAGNNMGSFFLPEVGNEVLVAFDEGDVRKPYVIGMLWNSKEKPPENNADGKNDIRKIKSRSGHEIIFDDQKGKENIVIQTAKGQTIMLEDKSGGKIQVKDKKGKNMVNIDGSKNEVSVKSDMKIKLQSKSCSLEIDASKNILKIQSGFKIQIKSKMIDIEAGAAMNLKAKGALNIKGSMVKIN